MKRLWWKLQQWLPALCLNLHDQKQQFVIRTQIPWIWRTKSLLPLWLLPANTVGTQTQLLDTAAFHRAGSGRVSSHYCARTKLIKLTTIYQALLPLKATSLCLDYRILKSLHKTNFANIMSRWRDKFLVLPTLLSLLTSRLILSFTLWSSSF